jgi:hypothetical protein
MRSTVAPSGGHPPRALGGNEKAFWKLSEASPLNFAVVAHVRPGLDAARVRAALADLQARHPLLRARIELRDGTPWFTWPIESAPIALDERTTPQASWRPVVEAELRRVIPWQRAPLAHALLLDHGSAGATVALLCHHAIGDGVGAVHAMRDLLWHAQTGAPRAPVVFDRSRAAESALPPASRGLRGGWKRLGVLAGLVTDGRRFGEPVRYPVRQAAAPHERTFHCEPRTFDPGATTAIATRARGAGSSVHGAIAAAMIFGVARAAGVTGERAVSFGSPINVRDRLAPPIGEQLGMYLGVSQFRGTVAPATRFWELARGIRQRITDDLESGRAVGALPLIELFTKALGGDAAPAQDFGRKWAESNGTTGLTNIGRIDFEAPPGLAIERVHTIGFPSGLDVFNALASAWGGSLLISFNWCEPCFDRTGALALVDDIEATLRAAVDGDPTLQR